MRPLKIIGFILILIGIAMLATGGFRFQQKKKVLDTNTVDITTTETKRVTWPWFAGGIAVIGGVILLLIGRQRSVSSGTNSVA